MTSHCAENKRLECWALHLPFILQPFSHGAGIITEEGAEKLQEPEWVPSVDSICQTHQDHCTHKLTMAKIAGKRPVQDEARPNPRIEGRQAHEVKLLA